MVSLLSVCPLLTTKYCAELAETINLPVGMMGWVAPRNNIINGGPAPPMKRGKFWKWGNGVAYICGECKNG